jgi:3-phenylpropionate/trans-cinnamate dioxygenase ferredoxin reductase subunit
VALNNDQESMKKIVIVGGGHAAAQFCTGLKTALPDAQVTLVSDEAHLPYHRPPLSKAFLHDPAQQPAVLKSESFYRDAGITLRLGETVAAIDRAGQAVVLQSGERIDYTDLVLATGTRPRAVPPALAEGGERIVVLRTVDDARRLRDKLHVATRVLIVGGGFIGLEIAASAAQLGKQVTVIEAAPSLLSRSCSPEIARALHAAQIAAGVDVRTGMAIDRVGEQNGVFGAWIGAEFLPADMIVVGIGAVPNQELAQAAGLECSNGIVVDACMRTSDPAILGIGDCTSFPSSWLGRHIRLESVQNANDQARCAAQTIAGKSVPYTALPWFWSDQGEMRLQIAGIWEPQNERVLRGDPSTGKFSVLHFSGDVLTSVESLNVSGDHLAARKLVGDRTRVSREKAADPSIPLKDCAAAD